MTASRTSSIHISTTAAAVFDFIKDPANFAPLSPEVAFTDVVKTPEGLGTTYVIQLRIAGLRLRGRGRFSEFEANKHIRDESSLPFAGACDYWLWPDDSGVNVRVVHHGNRLWAVPLLGRMLADSLQSDDQRILAKLKAALEADPSQNAQG